MVSQQAAARGTDGTASAVGASAGAAQISAARPKKGSRLVAWLRSKPKPALVDQPIAGASGTDSATIGSMVYSDAGLTRYMGRVHATAAAAFSGTLLASYGLSWAFPLASIMHQYPLQALGVALAATLGSHVWFDKAAMTVKVTYEPDPHKAVNRSSSDSSASAAQGGKAVYTAVNSASRKAAFVCFASSFAVVLTPIVELANFINPLIIPGAAGITALVMGGASAFAYRAKPSQLDGWGGPLCGGLLAVVSLQLAALGSTIALGPNPFAAPVYSYQPYVGIALFTALTAFDTHAAVEGYKARQPDHLAAALSIYLDALNLLMDFIHLILEFFSDAADAVSDLFD